MKTTQSISRNQNTELTNSGCIVKLERANKDLQQLERQFTSYIYEPTTYSLFDKSQTIRQSLSSLKDTNAELIATLKREKELKIELFEKTISQIRSFMEVQKSFDDYSRQLRH